MRRVLIRSIGVLPAALIGGCPGFVWESWDAALAGLPGLINALTGYVNAMTATWA